MKKLLLFLTIALLLSNCNNKERKLQEAEKKKILEFAKEKAIKNSINLNGPEYLFSFETNGYVRVTKDKKGKYRELKPRRLKSYSYYVYGFDENGNDVSGTIDVTNVGGSGYVFNGENEVHIDVVWVGNGKLEGYDENSVHYDLETH